MKQYIEIRCRHCSAADLVKNGRSENGSQRYRCNKCRKSFQHEYTYNAWKPGIKEQIEKQTLNSCGVRDISRNLDISKDTVISELRKKRSTEVNPYFMAYLSSVSLCKLKIEIHAESDELWRYVGNKTNQRWTWYAVERKSGVILVWHNCRRKNENCRCLMNKLPAFPITRYYINDWQSYKTYISSEKHAVGKSDTWKIERRNLNFRMHLNRLNRKTIGLSKNERIYDTI